MGNTCILRGANGDTIFWSTKGFGPLPELGHYRCSVWASGLRVLTHVTPWKINGWNLKITYLKRKIIWTKPPLLCSMLIFGGVWHCMAFSHRSHDRSWNARDGDGWGWRAPDLVSRYWMLCSQDLCQKAVEIMYWKILLAFFMAYNIYTFIYAYIICLAYVHVDLQFT